ncbi:MAG TPA: sulfate/molybdate ABC transporter ATP-binding protein [Kofleriaceae bacterium]|nr:sulfate/molybdate ABC transporter ATP-binding protein [Kofleriaceae bacterium]
MTITVENVSKRFGNFAAVDNVSVEIPSGGLVALLGPSGSGKTTLLRILSGLERPDSGRILHDGKDLLDRPARERDVGLVFQHYALFRHLDVFENIAFALRVRKRPKAEVNQRVEELLRLIQLEGLGRRMPSQLSGGQRQRVALARALAAAPQILLLDEPFGALDAQVRQELRRWLRRLHDEMDVTTVFVTHDQEEAFEVSDQVVIMDHGKIEQVGTPAEVFDHPASDFVLRFLGQVNVLHGTVADGRAKVGELTVAAPGLLGEERAARIYVRPHELGIEREPGPDRVAAQVVRLTPLGAALRVELDAGSSIGRVQAELERGRADALGLRASDPVYLTFRHARVFEEEPRAAA